MVVTKYLTNIRVCINNILFMIKNAKPFLIDYLSYKCLNYIVMYIF